MDPVSPSVHPSVSQSKHLGKKEKRKFHQLSAAGIRARLKNDFLLDVTSSSFFPLLPFFHTNTFSLAHSWITYIRTSVKGREIVLLLLLLLLLLLCTYLYFSTNSYAQTFDIELEFWAISSLLCRRKMVLVVVVRFLFFARSAFEIIPRGFDCFVIIFFSVSWQIVLYTLFVRTYVSGPRHLGYNEKKIGRLQSPRILAASVEVANRVRIRMIDPLLCIYVQYSRDDGQYVPALTRMAFLSEFAWKTVD